MSKIDYLTNQLIEQEKQLELAIQKLILDTVSLQQISKQALQITS